MTELKVLIGCEKSRIVASAFEAQGHDVWSCDLQPADVPTNKHIVADIREVMMWEEWDIMAVMHPPCTRLCNSGVRWLSKPPKNPPADCTLAEAEAWLGMSEEERLALVWDHLDRGAELFSDCWNVPHIPHVALENPVMHPHAKVRIRNYCEWTQTVQPWQYGTDEDGPDNEKKRTCLWLRNLPELTPTGTLDGTSARDSVHKASPGKNRGNVRSMFFPGLAAAMARQWSQHAILHKQRRVA